MPGAPDPPYVRAREILLDALEALGPHRASLVLVGAQAIYLHTGEANVAVAPYTTNADLVIDPKSLAGRFVLTLGGLANGNSRTRERAWWRAA